MGVKLLVGIAQCRVLDCDFKGYRCKPYYLPIIYNIYNKIQPLIKYTPSLQLYEIKVSHINFFASSLWYSNPITATNNHLGLIKRLRNNIDILKIFTKLTNYNKLYMVCTNKIFLSPGIILRFIKASNRRSLKKRIKVWYGFIKAGDQVFKNPVIVWFNDLIGKKSLLLNKLANSSVKISWIFFKMFYISYVLNTKKNRRIKRWVKKKYFRLSQNEHK